MSLKRGSSTGKIITLLTDFGLTDEYVASVKAIIYSIYPEANIIDVTHTIPPQDILKAALVLKTIIEFFPSESYHLVVVDPGVGSDRKIIIVKTKTSKFLVGPDNGVLYPAAIKDGIDKIIEFQNLKYARSKISHTFHGRDIMAPIVAYLAKGVKIEEFGVPIESIVDLQIEEYKINDNSITGLIIAVDNFGNLITSIPEDVFSEALREKNKRFKMKIIDKNSIYDIRLVNYFSEGKEDELICYVGSKGLLEVAYNKDNAFKKLGVKVGDRLTFIF
ncbi:MAG: SAM hydrolase/SAM-dependent halogenase family protein [Candidatus Odinarchaeia archaeon]